MLNLEMSNSRLDDVVVVVLRLIQTTAAFDAAAIISVSVVQSGFHSSIMMKLLFLFMLLFAPALVYTQSAITCGGCVSRGCTYCDGSIGNIPSVCLCDHDHQCYDSHSEYIPFHDGYDCDNGVYEGDNGVSKSDNFDDAFWFYFVVVLVVSLIIGCFLVGLCVWCCVKGCSSTQSHHGTVANHHAAAIPQAATQTTNQQTRPSTIPGTYVPETTTTTYSTDPPDTNPAAHATATDHDYPLVYATVCDPK